MENKPQKPKLLFQYRPPEAWAFGNLNRRILYFNSPLNFNDPHDFRYPPSLHNMTDDHFAFFKKAFEGDEEARYRRGESKDEFAIRVNQIIAENFAKLREDVGFACFSQCGDNLPMWSHYGGNGGGFCLAFDTNRDIGLFGDTNLAKMQYWDNLPDAADAVKDFDESRPPFYYSIAHKSREWEYEQEWRLFSTGNKENQSREVEYDPKALTAVYLGTDASDNTIALVSDIVREKYPHAELKKAKLDKDRYKLEFARL